MTNLLATSAATMGIDLSPEQLAQFEIYDQELRRWNERTNLTGITAREEVIVKHFLDSLSCLLAVPELPPTVVDVGSGAGFPGLVLKVVQPQIDLTLVEATGKKVDFLNHLVETLALDRVTVLHHRAEDVGRQPNRRAAYHLAVARAVALLPALVEYMLPLLRPHGLLLAQKGVDPAAEIATASKALEVLGGQHLKTIPVQIPGLDAARHLVLIEKVRPTPKAYPRPPGVPVKRPIR